MEPNENYRPISLLCIISKDLESCVRITLNNHVKQFIIPLQHDLYRFCITQLLSSSAFSQNVDKKYSNRSYLPGLAWLRLSIPLITKLCFKSSNDTLLCWFTDHLSGEFEKWCLVQVTVSSFIGSSSGQPTWSSFICSLY